MRRPKPRFLPPVPEAPLVNGSQPSSPNAAVHCSSAVLNWVKIAMKSLAEIKDFGATDADNDQILFQAFEEHEAHAAVKSRERFLIVGRKAP